MPIFKIVVLGTRRNKGKASDFKEVINLTAANLRAATEWALGICKYEGVEDLSIEKAQQINQQ